MDHDYIRKPVANKYRNTKYCCVPQCSTYGDTGISFHLFPKDEIMKKKWKTALRIGKPISPSMRVCSHHFQASNFFPNNSKRQKLFPYVVPSRNIPKISSVKEVQLAQNKKTIVRENRVDIRRRKIVESNNELGLAIENKETKFEDGFEDNNITDNNSHHLVTTSSTHHLQLWSSTYIGTMGRLEKARAARARYQNATGSTTEGANITNNSFEFVESQNMELPTIGNEMKMVRDEIEISIKEEDCLNGLDPVENNEELVENYIKTEPLEDNEIAIDDDQLMYIKEENSVIGVSFEAIDPTEGVTETPSKEVWVVTKDLCRCCHAEGAFLDLRSTTDGATYTYADLLQKYCDIQLCEVGVESAGLSAICRQCAARLRGFHEFCSKVRAAEYRFSAMYKENRLRVSDDEMRGSTTPQSDTASKNTSGPGVTDKKQNNKVTTKRNKRRCIRVSASDFKTEGNSHKCAHCEQKYQKKVSLLRHIKSDHLRSPSNECAECGATFSKPNLLHEHKLAKHSIDDREANHNYHDITSDHKNMYKSYRCEKIYNNKRRITDHVKMTHLKTHSCSDCDSNFNIKTQLLNQTQCTLDR